MQTLSSFCHFFCHSSLSFNWKWNFHMSLHVRSVGLPVCHNFKCSTLNISEYFILKNQVFLSDVSWFQPFQPYIPSIPLSTWSHPVCLPVCLSVMLSGVCLPSACLSPRYVIFCHYVCVCVSDKWRLACLLFGVPALSLDNLHDNCLCLSVCSSCLMFAICRCPLRFRKKAKYFFAMVAPITGKMSM